MALRPFLLFLTSVCVACSSPIGGTDIGPLPVDAPALDAPGDDAPALDAPRGDDAPSDAASPIDAPIDAPPSIPCTERAWGEPVLVAELSPSGVNAADARLTDDERLLVLNQDLRALEFERPGATGTFTLARVLDELDPTMAGPEFAPVLSRTGLTIYYAAHRGAATLDLYTATRTRVTDGFGISTRIDAVSTTGFDELGGFPGVDGLYYWSGAGGSPSELYVAPFVAGTLSAGVALTTLNLTVANDESPVVSSDGRTIYFASDRDVPGREGGADVYVATRDTVALAFTGARRVPELSTAMRDRPTWISVDQCRMYLDQEPITGGNYAIYYAERLP